MADAKDTKLSVRITGRGKQLIVDRATAADVRVSHQVRRMLDYALRHMPADYVPPRRPPSSPAAAGG